MPNSIVDIFTGTAGTTLESLSGWSKHTLFASGSLSLSGFNRVYSTVHTTGVIYLNSWTPPSADYDVAVEFIEKTSFSSNQIQIVGRMSNSVDTRYAVIFDANAAQITLYRLITGTAFLMGSYNFSPALNVSYELRLHMKGVAINALVNGVTVIAGSDANITAAGQAGVGGQSDVTATTGCQIGNFFAGAPLAITADNAAIKYFGFYQSGVGSSSYAQSNNSGNYALVNFSGSTRAIINFDVSILSGLIAANYPYVSYRMDGAAWTQAQLTSAVNAVAIPVSSTATAHRLEFMLSAIADDTKWVQTTPQCALKFTSVTLDTAATVSAPAILPKRGLAYGDSILANQYQTNDATKAIPYLIRTGMNSEIDVAAFSGQGYGGNASGCGANTTFANTWDHYDSTHSRLTTGSYTIPYDWIYVEHAYNNIDSAAEVQTQWESIRAAFAGPIYVQLGAYDGTNKAIIQTALTNYRAAHPADAKLIPVDLGTFVYSETSAPHPDINGQLQIANLLIPLQFEGASSFGGLYSGLSVSLSGVSF